MNLSISDFQRISNGTYNAGDITLTSSGKLDKVNNHVGLLKGWNNRTISVDTILQVKNAFVDALKNAGVDANDIAEVRKDLGLPMSGNTKGLDLTTLKPLTRAQTREILDRYESTINKNAGRTLVSNKWAALKVADDQNYRNHMDLASRINQQTVEDRAAAQKELGREIMDYGIDSIPESVQKSAVFTDLSEADKDKFAKKFSVMLLKGGADVSSIAAEAMKKVLISKYGGDIADKDRQALFRGMAANISATADLSRIDAEIKTAKDVAAGAKLEFDFGSDEMGVMLNDFRTIGKLGILFRNTQIQSQPKDFVDNFAKGLMGEEFLKDAVSCFGKQVKNIGELELDGKPTYKLGKLENGKTELILSFDARIGGGKKAAGARCEMRFEIDPVKNFYDCKSRMELKPAQKLVEFHKTQIIENIKNIALSKEAELPDDDVKAMEKQMSKWDDMGPGQMKNFEAWLKNSVSSYVTDCIEGKEQDPKVASSPLKFDENGICDVFIKDSTRGRFEVDGKKYIPKGDKNEGLEDAIFKALPDTADRKLITGLLNQSTVATMMYLCMDAPDPANENENAPSLRSLDQAGEHVANYASDNLILVNQPIDNNDSRYELQVDKEKKTATITITADYLARLNQDKFDSAFIDEKIGRGMEVGKVSYTYQFTVTGLGSGHPQVASANFVQTITARDM